MNKDILVACPSKGRSSDIMRNTLKFLLSDKFKYNFKVFVEPQDYDEYIRVDICKSKLINIGRNNQGLSFSKKQIQQYCFERRIKYVFKIDDDVTNIRLPELIGTKSTGHKYTKEQIFNMRIDAINSLISDSLQLLDEYIEVGAISIMYGSDFHQYNSNKWLSINNRLQSNYIVRNEFLCPKGGDYWCFEDFVTFFNILKKGSITMRYGLTAIEVEPVGINSGGIQSFDRRILALKEKELLNKLYPDLEWKKVEGKNWDFEPDLRKTKFIKTEKI